MNIRNPLEMQKRKKESTRLSTFIQKIKNGNVDWRKIIKWEIIHLGN